VAVVEKEALYANRFDIADVLTLRDETFATFAYNVDIDAVLVPKTNEDINRVTNCN